MEDNRLTQRDIDIIKALKENPNGITVYDLPQYNHADVKCSTNALRIMGYLTIEKDNIISFKKLDDSGKYWQIYYLTPKGQELEV